MGSRSTRAPGAWLSSLALFALLLAPVQLQANPGALVRAGWNLARAEAGAARLTRALALAEGNPARLLGSNSSLHLDPNIRELLLAADAGKVNYAALNNPALVRALQSGAWRNSILRTATSTKTGCLGDGTFCGLPELHQAVEAAAIKAALETPQLLAFTDDIVRSKGAAVVAMDQSLSTPAGMHLPNGVLAPGVVPASLQTRAAIQRALDSRFGSFDAGEVANNISHLSSVGGGAYERAAKELGRPLTQAEADGEALRTFLTDGFMKGVPADMLQDVPTAIYRTADGRVLKTGGEVQAYIKERALARFDAFGPLPKDVHAVAKSWIENGAVPFVPPQVTAAADAAGLSPASRDILLDAWQTRIADTGDVFLAQNSMLGIWLHGNPAYSLVEPVVAASGTRVPATEILRDVYTHHMAGFIANVYARLGLTLDFRAMEAAGHLPRGSAAGLQRFYDTTIELAAWRPIVDATIAERGGLTAVQRSEYRVAATEARAAAAELESSGLRQWVEDDDGQFRVYAIAKWFGIQPGATNGERVLNVFRKSAQAYLEESLALSESSGPLARNLAARSQDAATRLGITLQPDTLIYRPATPGEAAYEQLYRQIWADTSLRSQFLLQLDPGVPVTPASVVEWFRGSPTSVEDLNRIIQTLAPVVS